MQTHRFPEADRCIYCGNTDEGRTAEHLLAYAHGGDLLLPAASCVSCQRTINEEIEQPYLRGHLKPYRMLTGMRTKGKSKVSQKLPVVDASGTYPFTRYIPVHDCPVVISSPVYSRRPSSLHGFTADAKPPSWRNVIIQTNSEVLFSKYGITKLTITYPPEALFIRYLAKVAHAHAWPQLRGRLDEFKMLLPDVILGRKSLEMMRAFVGSHQSEMLPHQYSGTFVQTNFEVGPYGSKLVLLVNFFPRLNTPTYEIVVATSKLRYIKSDFLPIEGFDARETPLLRFPPEVEN
jgi:hypothetical protein